jgi:autotransporter translocation and assembly factor TamB
MPMLEPWLSIAVILLLVVTLFHAVRLERRLGVLKRDRAALEALVKGFNDATVRAEAATARLRGAAEGAGKALSAQLEGAENLKSDLAFLIERGEALADRLDAGVRSARQSAAVPAPVARAALPDPAPAANDPPAAGEPRLRSQAERDLLRALKLAR